MKNVSRKKGLGVDANPDHVEPTPVPLVKETSTGKSDRDYVKLKMRIDPTSGTSYLYGFRMSLFDHGGPEELLLFVKIFQITLSATVMLETDVGVQYICTLVRGKSLRQFDLLSSGVKNIETPLDVDSLLKSLAWYFSPANSIAKQSHCGYKDPRSGFCQRYQCQYLLKKII